ncbi:hypothetical protein PABG_05539 [Paracoccidioides brasiliensis Pb03]|nr:hypothetical protein PABG_05539 [Paracoccidioides brasiliensis Pb03]
MRSSEPGCSFEKRYGREEADMGGGSGGSGGSGAACIVLLGEQGTPRSRQRFAWGVAILQVALCPYNGVASVNVNMPRIKVHWTCRQFATGKSKQIQIMGRLGDLRGVSEAMLFSGGG